MSELPPPGALPPPPGKLPPSASPPPPPGSESAASGPTIPTGHGGWTPPPAGPGFPPAGGPPTGSPPGGGPVQRRGTGVFIALGVLGVMGLLVVGIAVALVVESGNEDGGAAGTDTVPPTTARVFESDSETATTPPLEGTRQVDMLEIEVGDCYNVPNDPDATFYDVVDCDRPHDEELIGVFFLPQGPEAPYPGDNAVSAAADRRCQGVVFRDYVGIPFGESELDAFGLGPVEESWDVDDRLVQCIATSADVSKLEGSLRGSRR